MNPGTGSRFAVSNSYVQSLRSDAVLAFGIIGFLLVLGVRIGRAQSSADNTASVERLEEQCPFSVDRFIVELQQDDSGRRWGAAECLGKMKDARGVEPLVRAILHESIPRLGLIETAALKEIDDPRTEYLLLSGVSNKQTRARAIEALGRLQSKRAVETIITALHDPDRFTASLAAGALAEIRDQRALLPLCGLLTSRDEVTRRYGAMSLGVFGDPKAVGVLIIALKDEDDGVRWNAAESLGKLGSTGAVDALTAAMQDSEEGVRVAAIDSLQSLADARAVQPLVSALGSGTKRVRWHAASPLASFSTSEAQDTLTNSLRHGQLDVVAAAYKYFLAGRDPDTISALIRAMSEHGGYEMANDFRNSGDSRLVDAAQQWELRHEMELQSQP